MKKIAVAILAALLLSANAMAAIKIDGISTVVITSISIAANRHGLKMKPS
jgi:hypothetical protein